MIALGACGRLDGVARSVAVARQVRREVWHSYFSQQRCSGTPEMTTETESHRASVGE
jgi:hypothetical protein